MDQISFDEILSCLAKCGRPDLIMELRELEKKIVDEDYDPSKERFVRKEIYSDEEGSAESEEVDFDVDEEGFHSLR
jgi:hypothetical protein